MRSTILSFIVARFTHLSTAATVHFLKRIITNKYAIEEQSVWEVMIKLVTIRVVNFQYLSRLLPLLLPLLLLSFLFLVFLACSFAGAGRASERCALIDG